MNPSLKEIKKLLAESAVDVRKPGRFAVIVDDATPQYLIKRGVEFVRGAELIPMIPGNGEAVDALLRDAITVLVLARAGVRKQSLGPQTD